GRRRPSLPRREQGRGDSGRSPSGPRCDYLHEMTGLRLLGPLELDGVPLPGGKPRALLARLGLDAGRVVAADTLVAALWGEHPPPSAHKVLQAHVSALR